MEPVTTLWFASFVGAAVFMAAGWFLAKSMTPLPVAAPAVETPPIAVLDEVGEDPKPPPRPSLPSLPPTPLPEVDVEKAIAEAVAAHVEREKKLEEEIVTLRTQKEDAEMHLTAVREELRGEILQRADAAKRAADLTTRLDAATQQVAALRARLSADDPMRRASMTPPAPRVSMPPGPQSMNPQRMAALAPGLFGELEELRRENSRLKSEIESLRVSAFTKK